MLIVDIRHVLLNYLHFLYTNNAEKTIKRILSAYIALGHILYYICIGYVGMGAQREPQDVPVLMRWFLRRELKERFKMRHSS